MANCVYNPFHLCALHCIDWLNYLQVNPVTLRLMLTIVAEKTAFFSVFLLQVFCEYSENVSHCVRRGGDNAGGDTGTMAPLELPACCDVIPSPGRSGTDVKVTVDTFRHSPGENNQLRPANKSLIWSTTIPLQNTTNFVWLLIIDNILWHDMF